MKRRRTGFTLPELLLALGIVAALAALSLSLAPRLRENARAVRCLANLRQWGVALHLHAAEHGGALPRRGQGVQTLARVDRASDWFNALPPYLSSPRLADLAAQGRRIRPDDGSVHSCPSAIDRGGDHFLPYAMNMYLSPWIRPSRHRLSEISDWSTLVFLADGPGAWSSTLPSRLDFSAPARHAGRVHLCFLDGHVASRPGREVGCGTGDPRNPALRWETGTSGVNQAPLP